MRILLGCFIFGIIGLFTIIGVMTPGAGWFLYLFLIPFWAMFPMIIVGVKGALVLLPFVEPVDATELATAIERNLDHVLVRPTSVSAGQILDAADRGIFELLAPS